MNVTGRTLPARALVGMRIALCALAGAVPAGCASVPLGLQGDGTYILAEHERSLDCDKLYKNLWGRVQLMKELPPRARAELQESPPTAALALGRIFGGRNKGLATIDEFDREAAHADALNRTMLSKGCAGLDLERELADANQAIAALRAQ